MEMFAQDNQLDSMQRIWQGGRRKESASTAFFQGGEARPSSQVRPNFCKTVYLIEHVMTNHIFPRDFFGKHCFLSDFAL